MTIPAKDRSSFTPMTQETFEKICIHVSDGLTTLKACRMEGYTARCMYGYITNFGQQKLYRKARKKHVRAFVDRFMEKLDATNTRYEDGKHTCVDNAIIAKRKVQLDSLRFYLTMVDGKKYGTKRDTETHRKLKGWKGNWTEKLVYIDKLLAGGKLSPETAKVLYELVKKGQEIVELPELMRKVDELRENAAIREMLKSPLPRVHMLEEGLPSLELKDQSSQKEEEKAEAKKGSHPDQS